MAMADTREKTLSYRHAEWLEAIPKGTTLESCLRDAHNTLKTVDERTIVRDSGQCIRSANKSAPRDGGIFVHLTADTPGEQASVVPKKGNVEAIEVGTAAAPSDAEFMDGDAFLYVNGDHVCMCSTGLRDGAMRLFLYEFFTKARLGKHATKFDLLKVPSLDKMKMLNREGVKQIDLRASLFQATTRYENRKTKALGALRTLARHVMAVVAAEKENFDQGLRVAITIKTDDRVMRKHLAVGEKRIEALARDVLSNFDQNDDFIIETQGGDKIRADEIFVKEVVFIDRFGKSVKCKKAWEYLERFYGRLKKSGALGQ
jgi:hypothetical protein